MTDSPSCPRCGAALPADVPEGVCPACELRAALEGDASQQPLPPLQDDGPALPRPFGDYVLLEEVARGGMGVVYKARQASLDRIVAVKLLPFGALTNPAYVKRFRAEAAAAAGLQHPNIVTVHEVGAHQGQHYLVMNFINGPPLSRLVAQGPLTAKQAAAFLKTVAEAVHHAHQHGILHRDLKPSNVLIDENNQPMVTDFGLAKRMDGESSLTLTGHVLGSPNYMPPEQASSDHGRVTRRTDVYGLGATLYHLLTGRPPFQAATLNEAIQQVLSNEPASPRLINPSVPRDLETICLKCLEKEPERRYETAEAVAQELERFLNGQPVLARPVGPAGKTWRWCRRRPLLAGLSAALIVTLAAGLVGVLWQWRRAVANEWLARQNAYAADMNHAQQSLEEGDFGTALSLLNKYRPENSSDAAFGSRSSADLRGWEWRYLWQLCQSDELFTLCRYESWVGGVAVSADGNVLAVQRGDGHVALWNLPDRREITNLPASGNRGTIAFSPAGNLLAAANSKPSGAAEVCLWNLRNLEAKVSLPHEAPVLGLAFSPDGNFLATQDKLETVRVWEVGSRQVVTNFQATGRTAWPSGRWPWGGLLRFSPDGTRLGLQNAFSSIRVVDWHAGTNTLVIDPPQEQERPTMSEQVTALAFSPRGRLLAWGKGDGTIRLWDRAKGESAGDLTGHDDSVVSLEFTPDGKRLASASSDQTIRIWDLADHSQVRCLRGNENEVWALDFLPDGKTLVSGGKDGSVRFWDVTMPEMAPPHRVLRIILPYFIRDGQQFIGLNDPDGQLSLWDAPTLKRIRTLSEFSTNIYCFGISPDEQWLAVRRWDENSVRVWDWTTRTQVTNLVLPSRAFGVDFFPDSKTVVAQYDLIRPDQTVGRAWKTWRIGSWEEINQERMAQLKPNPWAAVLSPDGRVSAVGYESGEVELRSMEEFEHVTTLPGDPSSVMDIRFAPDGRLLAVASWDDFVKVWDVQSREVLMTLRSHFTHNYSVDFSPDGKRLAVGGVGGGGSQPQVKLWDLATQRELLTLPGGFWNVQFSPDGNTLVVMEKAPGVERTHLWRAPSWQEIAEKENAAGLR